MRFLLLRVHLHEQVGALGALPQGFVGQMRITSRVSIVSGRNPIACASCGKGYSALFIAGR